MLLARQADAQGHVVQHDIVQCGLGVQTQVAHVVGVKGSIYIIIGWLGSATPTISHFVSWRVLFFFSRSPEWLGTVVETAFGIWGSVGSDHA